MPAPLLALVDVGEVDLDRGQPGDLERVADRLAVVGPGAGVEQRRVGDLGQPVQALDEVALVVGLKERDLEVELAAEALDLRLELGAG